MKVKIFICQLLINLFFSTHALQAPAEIAPPAERATPTFSFVEKKWRFVE